MSACAPRASACAPRASVCAPRASERVASRAQYALLYFTGSDHFNRSMRHYAKARGYSLSDHGIVAAVKSGAHNIVRGTQNLAPQARTEADIFAALGLQYVEPADRNCEVHPVAGAAPALTM